MKWSNVGYEGTHISEFVRSIYLIVRPIFYSTANFHEQNGTLIDLVNWSIPNFFLFYSFYNTIAGILRIIMEGTNQPNGCVCFIYTRPNLYVCSDACSSFKNVYITIVRFANYCLGQGQLKIDGLLVRCFTFVKKCRQLYIFER